MSKFRRQLMMASMSEPVPPTPVLPYDVEVEWISMGQFDLDYVPSTKSYHKWSYRFLAYVNYTYLFQNTGSTSGTWLFFGGYESAGTNFLYGSTAKVSGFKPSLNTTYTAEADFRNNPRLLKFDGVTKYSLSANAFTNQHSLQIQLSKNGNNAYSLDWYQCVDGGELVLDIIPVRVGQVGYLYDKVRRRLIGVKDGSPAATFGNDKTT